MTQEEKELRIKSLQADKLEVENFIRVATDAEEFADETINFFMEMNNAISDQRNIEETATFISEGMKKITALAMSTKISSSMAVKLKSMQMKLIDAQLKKLGIEEEQEEGNIPN